LDPRRDLDGIDVVLDAGHVSLNRIWTPLVPLSRRRWAFQRKIRQIADHCGAMFSHAHGPDFGVKVRDCDNWIAYRGEVPFPGEAAGFSIAA
jgi:hypothetical protein